ncbi:MAG: hypothetical protein IPN33_26120 [Saprospiraceae bacterium]|nr:hypothetical protein [Saprospiraceae bacterium]
MPLVSCSMDDNPHVANTFQLLRPARCWAKTSTSAFISPGDRQRGV